MEEEQWDRWVEALESQIDGSAIAPAGGLATWQDQMAFRLVLKYAHSTKPEDLHQAAEQLSALLVELREAYGPSGAEDHAPSSVELAMVLAHLQQHLTTPVQPAAA